MPARGEIRLSSTRCPTGPINEARRHLDGRWRQGDAGKPRPVVIIQDDSFDATASITICTVTADETDAPLFRLPVQPNERNSLRAVCRLMVDKISTVPKTKVVMRVGRLDDEDILRLNQAVLMFLGLAVSPGIKQS